MIMIKNNKNWLFSCWKAAVVAVLTVAPTISSFSLLIPPTTTTRATFILSRKSFGVSSSSPLYMSAADTASSSAPSSSSPSSKLTRLPQSAVQVDIVAPGSSTQAAYDKVCRELSKQIAIPGFRKGAQVPPQVLEQAMAAKGGRMALRKEAINSLISQLIEPTLKQEYNLEPIGQPTLLVSVEELANTFVPGQDLQLQVQCDVWPDLEWTNNDNAKPYLGLTGSYKRKPFNQAKLEASLQDLKERYAILNPKDADPTNSAVLLEMGDACTVQMVGYFAKPDGTKGDPLPNAASGDNVQVILGPGRYMEGLVEGLVGARVGDTKTISVQFPMALRDKTLAGKAAVFDVKVLEALQRSLPDVTDELANQIRPGMTADGLLTELRKAIDEDDTKEITPARNAALSKALADLVNVEIPETLITNQAREKFAVMMTEMRDNGTPDDVIKKSITPENFEKYKKIVRDDIIRDFRVSMALDEIARTENIQVPDYQVDEQLQAIKKDAQESNEEFDEASIRRKVENTLQRQMVYDFLAQHANLQVEYQEEDAKFDEELMNKLADEALQREREAAEAAASVTTEGKVIVDVKANNDDEDEAAEARLKEETEARAKAEKEEEEARLKQQEARLKAEAEAKAKADEEARLKAEAEAKAKAEEEARLKAEAEAKAKAEEEARLRAEAEAREKEAEEARLKAEEEEKAKWNLRLQPKSPETEAEIAARYASLSVEERAFQILLDVGAIAKTVDPDDPNYDNSQDDEPCSDIRYL